MTYLPIDKSNVGPHALVLRRIILLLVVFNDRHLARCLILEKRPSTLNTYTKIPRLPTTSHQHGLHRPKVPFSAYKNLTYTIPVNPATVSEALDKESSPVRTTVPWS